MSTDTQFPVPAEGQNPMEFIKTQAEQVVKEKLKARMVEMFSKPKPTLVHCDGDELYILDTIYDVWPDEEKGGKEPKFIYDIVLGKIRDYERIYDLYKYKNSEYAYHPGGEMRFIFHFTKQINY